MTDTTEVTPNLLPFRVTQDENQDGSKVHFESNGILTLVNSTITRGGPIAGYRNLIRNGLNATSGLTGDRSRFLDQEPADLHFGIQLKTGSPTFGYRDVLVKGLVVRPGMTPQLPLAVENIFIRADNQARTQFYNQLAGEQSRFKGMVFAGELRETLHMIRHPVTALRRRVGQYLGHVNRYGRQIARPKRVKWVRDTWLEYSFGMRPMISDIDSAIEEFYHSQWVRPIFKMVRGRGRGEEFREQSSGTKDLGYGFLLSWKNTRRTRADVKYYGIIRSTGSGITNVHTYGFAPWEFVPTLWELIPFSFLVDYFTNIGNILSSWSYRFIECGSATRGTSLADICQCENVKFEWKPTSFDPALYHHWMSGSPGNITYERAKIERGIIGTVPLPEFQVQVPGFDSLKWLNIAALTTLLGKTRRGLNL